MRDSSNGLLLRHGALARALPRARIRARPLPPRRQVAPVPQTAVAADLHQPLDVHRDLLAEVTLDATHFLDHPADLADVVFRQILDADIRAHAGRAEDVIRPLAADSVDVGETDLDALGARQIDACDTCHTVLASLFSLLGSCSGSVPASHFDGSEFGVRSSMFGVRSFDVRSSATEHEPEQRTRTCELPLTLLVFRVRADHAHHTAAADHLALVANPLH